MGSNRVCRALCCWLSAVWVLAGAAGHSPAGALPSSTSDALSSGAALSPGILEEPPARGKLLIAARQLAGPAFARSVVLLLEYDARGALGLVINRPSEVALTRLVPDLAGIGGRDDRVHLGGPVERNRLFMLMRADVQPPGTERILDDVFGSSTLAPLRALAAAGAAQSAVFVVYAGYAGWAPGQLDVEIERGDWHVTAGRSEHVFDTAPTELWPRLIRSHGGQWVERPPARQPAFPVIGALRVSWPEHHRSASEGHRPFRGRPCAEPDPSPALPAASEGHGPFGVRWPVPGDGCRRGALEDRPPPAPSSPVRD